MPAPMMAPPTELVPNAANRGPDDAAANGAFGGGAAGHGEAKARNGGHRQNRLSHVRFSLFPFGIIRRRGRRPGMGRQSSRFHCGRNEAFRQRPANPRRFAGNGQSTVGLPLVRACLVNFLITMSRFSFDR